MKLTNKQFEAIINNIGSHIDSERARIVKEFIENHNFESDAVFAEAMSLVNEAEELRNRTEGFLEESRLNSKISTFSFLQYSSKEVEKLLKHNIAVMHLPAYSTYNMENEFIVELITSTLGEATEKIINKYTKWDGQECNSKESSTTN